VKIMAKLDIAEKRLPQDGRIMLRVKGKEIDFRVSSIPKDLATISGPIPVASPMTIATLGRCCSSLFKRLLLSIPLTYHFFKSFAARSGLKMPQRQGLASSIALSRASLFPM
jgi:hypothetical protein